MQDDPPRPARLLGYAGLIPFGALALAALLGPAEWRTAVLAALAAYGAAVLAFLGAVHWGLALRPAPGEAVAAWPRLGLGVLPALLAWVALLLPPTAALLGLAVGIAATLLAEEAAARAGLIPPGYLRLRRVLSGGAVLCLALGAAASA